MQAVVTIKELHKAVSGAIASDGEQHGVRLSRQHAQAIERVLCDLDPQMEVWFKTKPRSRKGAKR